MRRAGICVAVALVAAGCGTTPGTGSEAKLKASVETFIDVCTGDDPEAALDMLTDAARDRFLDAKTPVKGCGEILGLKLPRSAPEPVVQSAVEEVKVGETTVKGDFATVVLEPRGGEHIELELQNLGGRWRLATALPPPPLPPPPPPPPPA